MKILIVFGTRPEAIKLAPFINLLKERAEFNPIVCVTGQHREMLDQVLDIFNITPDYDLALMKQGQDLFDITIRALDGLKRVISESKPSCVIVHGDTTTTLVASLASYYFKIPVLHVEAGLRTHNKYSPWPEEMNRRITGNIADLHFAPTITSKNNLLKEGVSNDSIVVTGNTVIDALLSVRDMIDTDMSLKDTFDRQFSNVDFTKKIILVTGHRRENFGSGFISICNAIKTLSQRSDVEIIYPVHLNPNVLDPVNSILSGLNNVHLIKPLDYIPFVYLLMKSYFVMTDSGGIQEEAPSLGKPVLVMRDTTERPEAVEAGTVKLVGTDEDTIVAYALMLLDDSEIYRKMSEAHNPYGDGKASVRIIDSIRNWRKV